MDENIDLSSQSNYSNVQFDESRRSSSAQYSNTKSSKLTSWIVRYSGGLIKNDRQAQLVAWVIVIILIASSLMMLFGGKENQQEFVIYPAEGPLENIAY